MEAGLRVIFQPGKVFDAFARMPPPAFPQTMLCILFWTGCGLVLTLAAALQHVSGAWNLGPLAIAGFLLGGVILSVPAAFIAAAVLHALAMLSGGKAGFIRSFQVVGLLGAMVPAAALTLFFPAQFIWIIPTAYLTFLAVKAVESIHDAPGGQAWLIIGCFGCLAAGSQLLFHKTVRMLQYRLENMAVLYSTASDAMELMEQFQMDPAAAPAPITAGGAASAGAGYVMPSGAPDPYRGGPLGGAPPGADATPDQVLASSLDMLRSGAFAPGPDGRPGTPSEAQVQQLFKMGQAMSKATSRALEANPEALNAMPPEQRRLVKQLLGQVDGMAQGQVDHQQMTRTLQMFLKSVQRNGGFDPGKIQKQMNALPPPRPAPSPERSQ